MRRVCACACVRLTPPPTDDTLFLPPNLPDREGISLEISICQRNNPRVQTLVSSASVAVRTECFFCGQVSGVISGRAGCPCSRPFFLRPCAVSLDTANEKMAAGQPGPLTLACI